MKEKKEDIAGQESGMFKNELATTQALGAMMPLDEATRRAMQEADKESASDGGSKYGGTMWKITQRTVLDPRNPSKVIACPGIFFWGITDPKTFDITIFQMKPTLSMLAVLIKCFRRKYDKDLGLICYSLDGKTPADDCVKKQHGTCVGCPNLPGKKNPQPREDWCRSSLRALGLGFDNQGNLDPDNKLIFQASVYSLFAYYRFKDKILPAIAINNEPALLSEVILEFRTDNQPSVDNSNNYIPPGVPALEPKGEAGKVSQIAIAKPNTLRFSEMFELAFFTGAFEEIQDNKGRWQGEELEHEIEPEAEMPESKDDIPF